MESGLGNVLHIHQSDEDVLNNPFVKVNNVGFIIPWLGELYGNFYYFPVLVYSSTVPTARARSQPPGKGVIQQAAMPLALRHLLSAVC